MNNQKFLVKFIVVMGCTACTTTARITKPVNALNIDERKTHNFSKSYHGQFDSDPTLRAEYSPLRLSNETCRENRGYVLKQTPTKQIEFGVYQNLSFSNLSFDKSGFFTGYRCIPQP